MNALTLEEGRTAVGLARSTLVRFLGTDYGDALLEAVRTRELPPVFHERRGLFVTLSTFPMGELRGCIGFSEPHYPLGEGIARAAWLAAREDPRFPAVTAEEVPHLLIEVSVLSPLERIVHRTPDDLVREVQIGRDGLVVIESGTSGLLLPQVPVDEGWTVKEFLSGVCVKAGLSPAAWTRPGPRFWRFTSAIFTEKSPGGPVVQREEIGSPR